MSSVQVCLKKEFPNMLTLLRVVLTCALNLYIYSHFGSLAIPVAIFSVICLTDYYDGKIARLYGSSSRFGAAFDVSADLFYIVSSYSLLWHLKILPFWFLMVIIFKFTEFVFTSYFLKKFNGENPALVFDFIGRMAAVLFYIIPILAYMSFLLSNSVYFFVVQILIYIITLMVVASSSLRLSNCVKAAKSYTGAVLKMRG